MSNIIHVLPKALSDQIAAGEVLERSASAIKELVENSLDAGATAIEIEIEDGGRKRICVCDNGCGMSAEDAKLSILRHATSKIRATEDLAAISTMGFRGEALASMAAVSRMSVTTQQKDADIGTYLHIEGAEITDCHEKAAPVGTQIVLEDLFFNTPARLKFLKTTATENRRVYEAVEQFALACHEVHWKLTIDNKVKCDFPAHKNLSERARAVFGSTLCDHLYPIESTVLGDVSIEGLFGDPEYGASSSGRTYTFVNRRIVRDKVIQGAVNQAYREFLHGKLPCVVLFIALPLDRVDVNVHPTKQEVRFAEPDLVFRTIQRALRSSLEKTPWIKSSQPNAADSALPRLSSVDLMNAALNGSSDPSNHLSGSSKIDRAARAFSQTPPSTQAAAHYFSMLPDAAYRAPEDNLHRDFGLPPQYPGTPKPAQTADNPEVSEAEKPRESAPRSGFAFDTSLRAEQMAAAALEGIFDGPPVMLPSMDCTPPMQAENVQVNVESAGFTEPAESSAVTECHAEPAQPETKSAPDSGFRLMPPPGPAPRCTVAVQKELPLQNDGRRGYFSSLHYIGQLALTYLLCSDGDSLVVIDQHAAHERINFERLKRVIDASLPQASQGLLFPLLLHLDTRLADVLAEYLPFFEKLGFQIDDLGSHAFALRSVPEALVGYDYQAILQAALADIAENGRTHQFDDIRDDILATMACHSSIRSGRRMSAADAAELFRLMDETGFRSNCPHGRPVHFVISASELEKRFLRIGYGGLHNKIS